MSLDQAPSSSSCFSVVSLACRVLFSHAPGVLGAQEALLPPAGYCMWLSTGTHQQQL